MQFPQMLAWRFSALDRRRRQHHYYASMHMWRTYIYVCVQWNILPKLCWHGPRAVAETKIVISDACICSLRRVAQIVQMAHTAHPEHCRAEWMCIECRKYDTERTWKLNKIHTSEGAHPTHYLLSIWACVLLVCVSVALRIIRFIFGLTCTTDILICCSTKKMKIWLRQDLHTMTVIHQSFGCRWYMIRPSESNPCSLASRRHMYKCTYADFERYWQTV